MALLVKITIPIVKVVNLATWPDNKSIVFAYKILYFVHTYTQVEFATLRKMCNSICLF